MVYLRTDDENYFEQMMEVFAARPLFRSVPHALRFSRISDRFRKGFRGPVESKRCEALIY
jgi:tRNA G46 methylase TrmB